MKAIVSLANARGNYYRGLTRLGESLKDNFDGQFFGFMNEQSVGAPLHVENPYAFKLYAIEKVRDLGYTQIIWVDSSVWAIKNVQPAFDIINAKGYLMQEAGQFVGRWTNDETLEYFNLSREKANSMLMYGNAGLLGLDFNSAIANSFFNAWRKSMQSGMFKGSWDNHRHDMSSGSIIANMLGMTYESGNNILQYSSPYQVPQNETIIFYAQGL